MMLMITRPLSRDGGMAVDHGVTGVEQHSRVWIIDHKQNCQGINRRREYEARTVQNEMRHPGLGDHRRWKKRSHFCRFYQDNNLKESCVRYSIVERGHSEQDAKDQARQLRLKVIGCLRVQILQKTSSQSKKSVRDMRKMEAARDRKRLDRSLFYKFICCVITQ